MKNSFLFIFVFFFISFLFQIYCVKIKKKNHINNNQNHNQFTGINLSAFTGNGLKSKEINDELNEIKNLKSQYLSISLIPMLQDNITSSIVYHATERILPSKDSLRLYIRSAKSKGLKIFIKFMVLTKDLKFGYWLKFLPDNPELWFKTYGDILVEYAQLAEEEKIDIFSIGVELSKISVRFYNHWSQLVKRIRSIYKFGKITYTSLLFDPLKQNDYKKYEKVILWDLVDLIGLDSYPPLNVSSWRYNSSSLNIDPSVKERKERWNFYFNEVRNWIKTKKLISTKRSLKGGKEQIEYKKVILTEVGFLSTDYCAVIPWYAPTNCTTKYFSPNFVCQSKSYSAFFESVKENQDFISGFFLFWFDNPKTPDFIENRNVNKWACFFTPRLKPSYEIIKTYFKSFNSNSIENSKFKEKRKCKNKMNNTW